MPTLHVYGIARRAPELTCLLSPGDVREVMEFRACNRTELYLVSEADKPVVDNRFLRYHYQNGQAAAHLFAVAAGLPGGGEQIASQLARAAGAGTVGPVLERLVAAALRCARRIRRASELAGGTAGTGPAVLEAIHRLGARNMRVLLLGAGAAAEEVAIHLLDSGNPSCQITIAGVWARDKRTAIRFATNFGVPRLSALEAARSLHDVDAVIAAGRGPAALLSEPVLAPVLAARPNPLLVVDLGAPSNLDSCLAERDGLNVIFHQRRKGRTRIRQVAPALAERIVELESLRFEKWRIQSPVRQTRVASTARTGFWLGQVINQSDPLGCGR